MKRKLFLIFSVFSVISAAGVFAELKVEPAGIKVIWNTLEKEFDGFKTYNEKKGVYLSLGVFAGDKKIISYNKDNSKVSMKSGDENLGGEFGHFEKISKSGKVMRLEVKSDQLPEGGDGKISVDGNMELVVASKSEIKSSKLIKLEKGMKITLADNFRFEIAEIKKPSYGDYELEIELKRKRDIRERAAVRFLNKEGKEIESKTAGWSSFGNFGKKTVTKSYQIKKRSSEVRIEMDLWVDAKKITVPFTLNVSLLGGS